MDLVVTSPDDEAFLLDLLNTTPVIDGVPHDDLEQPEHARLWMAERGIAATDTELTALREARSLLQEVVRGEQSPRTMQRFLDAVSLRPTATDDGLSWQMVLGKGPQGAVRAVLAWDALRISRPGRLRPCANAKCQLFLIDRSKPNNARWCSMAICGNRMKAHRHYRRSRSADAREHRNPTHT